MNVNRRAQLGCCPTKAVGSSYVDDLEPALVEQLSDGDGRAARALADTEEFSRLNSVFTPNCPIVSLIWKLRDRWG